MTCPSSNTYIAAHQSVALTASGAGLDVLRHARQACNSTSLMQWPRGIAVSFAGLMLLIICSSKGNHWAFPQGLALLQQDTDGTSTAKEYWASSVALPLFGNVLRAGCNAAD